MNLSSRDFLFVRKLIKKVFAPVFYTYPLKVLPVPGSAIMYTISELILTAFMLLSFVLLSFFINLYDVHLLFCFLSFRLWASFPSLHAKAYVDSGKRGVPPTQNLSVGKIIIFSPHSSTTIYTNERNAWTGSTNIDRIEIIWAMLPLVPLILVTS